MNEENFDAWVSELESGRYEQASGQLVVASPDGGKEYCCLGVGCTLLPPGEGGWERQLLAPPEFVEYLGLETTTDDRMMFKIPRRFYTVGAWEEDQTFSSVSGMNDRGDTFAQIAQWLRDNRHRIVARGVLG